MKYYNIVDIKIDFDYQRNFFTVLSRCDSIVYELQLVGQAILLSFKDIERLINFPCRYGPNLGLTGYTKQK